MTYSQRQDFTYYTHPHFWEQFDKRMEKVCSQELIDRILLKCYNLVKNSKWDVSESICLHVFGDLSNNHEQLPKDDTEDGFWIICRKRRLETCWRRNEDKRNQIRNSSFNVDKMTYQLISKKGLK